MKKRSKYRQFVKIISVVGLLILFAPYIISKLGFYDSTFASYKVGEHSQGAYSLTFADAVARAEPSIVSIRTVKDISQDKKVLLQDPNFKKYFNTLEPNKKEDYKEVEHGFGSGVIVDARGYILTNDHVIKNVDSVLVILANGLSTEGKVVGTDPDSDLAVIKIEADNLPVMTIGESKALRTGDIVLAIGNPYGLEKTVTQGIISATERSGASVGILENLLQTDAAINPGNSGGALIDINGRLVGINTAMYSSTGGSQGIGFSIPIDEATLIMNNLIKGIKIRRGNLGVVLQKLTPEMRTYLNYKEPYGAYIRAITKGGSAEKNGLQPGDIITKINNQLVKNEREAVRMIANLTPDQEYPFEIYRNEEYHTFSIVVGERKGTP